ncbi:MAG: Gfo/Idh/MocA family oxidoreductase [Bacteroidota bacterium]
MSKIIISRRNFVGRALAGSALLVAYPWLQVLSDNFSQDYSQKIKLGVIGVGSRGLLLLHYLTQLSEKINIEVVAVCDNYEPHYQRAIKKTDAKAKAFYDYRKLLEIKEIDAVIIATPLHEHARISIDALTAGKHVFCEKAMARTLDDVKRMADTHYETAKVLQIGHQRLFDPRYLKAIELINAGEIGLITQIRAYWHRNNDWRRAVPEGHPELEQKINWRLYKEYSCGLMTELASHQIQVANWMKNAQPVSVMGAGSINYWKDGREVYDNVALIYTYDDGTQFIYDSMTSNRHYGLEEQILGDKGTLEMEVNKRYFENPPPAPETPPPAGIVQLLKDIETGIFGDAIPLTNSSWIPELKVEANGSPIAEKGQDFDESSVQLEAFVAAVRNGTPTKGVFEQAYWASVWTLLGQQAMEEKNIITLPDKMLL